MSLRAAAGGVAIRTFVILSVSEESKKRILTSGCALLRMTLRPPYHCEPVTDVTGVSIRTFVILSVSEESHRTDSSVALLPQNDRERRKLPLE